MTTTAWKIESLFCHPQVDGETDVVFSVAWRVNGTDGTYNATVYGVQPLAARDEKTAFTKYADLSEAQVISWVQDAMGDEQVAAIEANIEQQIENQVNPPVSNPALPWLAQAK
jgi:hypothetical protein